LKNQVWLSRLLHEFLGEHKVPLAGPLFRIQPGDSTPATVSRLDEFFHRYLRKLQEARPDILSPGTVVERVFSLRRSLRRGSTTHARNRAIPKDVIESNNRWRKQERAKNREASLSMLDTYTDVVAVLEMHLVYSRAL
jgi:hypothetical protein